jgi:predicted RNA binding protein YcfA (HicA-like mRNA interferase family)
MGLNDFRYIECCRALRKLGFWHDTSRRGRHDKYVAPESLKAKLAQGAPEFITVPRHREFHCQIKILQELRRMGGAELVEQFKKLL